LALGSSTGGGANDLDAGNVGIVHDARAVLDFTFLSSWLRDDSHKEFGTVLQRL
jgi:hypothetical protein